MIKIKCILLLLLVPILAFSQAESQDLTKKELRKSRARYLNISIGGSSSNYRDFATSPLIYSGSPIFIGLSRLRMDQKRESEFGLNYSLGAYESTFNNHISKSNLNAFSLFYSQLYQLPRFNSKKVNLKVGGLFKATTNIRQNRALGNNGLGFEVIPTLFASGKIEFDISRKSSVDKKLWFINYKLKQKERALAFRLNIGVINNSYRNGYVYQGQSPILNDFDLVDGYQLDVFSGFRMSSSLDYNVFLKNKNVVQLSYLWEAYQTEGEFEDFEMASHTFKVSLLFNTNNK